MDVVVDEQDVAQTGQPPNDAAGKPPSAFIVLNPMAGTSDAATVRATLEQHFAPAGIEYDVYETTGNEDLTEIVRQAVERGIDVAVAAGGDGTVSEVANAVAGHSTALALLPVGTANVLARELGIPIDLQQAVALIAGQHATRAIDAMKVGDRHFVLQIGVGLDSLMIRDTDRESKRRFGQIAYLWTLGTRLLGYQPRRFTVYADGERRRPRAAQVLIANGGALGVQSLRWGPNITPSDGQIDVCIIGARTLVDYLGLLWHTLIGQQRRNRNVRYMHAQRSIVVNADRPLPVQADGEIIGETPVQVTVVPAAVNVVVPQSAEKPAATS
ncbi:MAG TPA: diacylglycerol kinase family protein [Roseiflexaceae bacterium]|nr:diacylglycerol kinase family protein [Roseiflexaceae bacterium]